MDPLEGRKVGRQNYFCEGMFSWPHEYSEGELHRYSDDVGIPLTTTRYPQSTLAFCDIPSSTDCM